MHNVPLISPIINQKVIKVVKSLNVDEYFILIKKNSISKNVPCKDTLITKEHGIFINGKLFKAKNLVNDENIYIKKTKRLPIYNILLNKHNRMIVNNMVVETLNPKDNPFK